MKSWDEKALAEAFTEESVERAAKGEAFVVFPDEGAAMGVEEYCAWMASGAAVTRARRYVFTPIEEKGEVVEYAVSAVGGEAMAAIA